MKGLHFVQEDSPTEIGAAAANDDQLVARAKALASELALGPTRAYAGVKRLLYRTATNPPYEQMEVENESIADVARTADAQEGIAAFLAKRPPQFNGR